MEILISAGDPSGDLHAANLAREIKKLNSGIHISAVGGKKLNETSDTFIYDIVGLNLHGLPSVKQYFNLKKLLNEDIAGYLKKNKPTAIIPVDFYGFNIKLAQQAQKQNIPVYYFISPQIWATRPERINAIKEFVNHISVIFPFEEKIYSQAGVPVTFVGNPLLDTIPTMPHKALKNSSSEGFTIGLFPGSRKQVVSWNLQTMLDTAKLIKDKYPQIIFKIIGLYSLKNCYMNVPKDGFEILYESDYITRANFDFAITTSGTVALENTLIGLPMLVMYKLPWPLYFLIKSIIKVSSVTITNLLTNEKLVPEFLQRDAQPDKIANTVLNIISDENKLADIKQKLENVRDILGEPGVYNRTAKLILEKINGL
ncbi:MAG: lipid-A-disaccharide synthase [Elusimicrobia bacterium]|nr:lipid-A-disaccharide synthase [Elusimicrobiota bacterium]MBU2614053.1 lipid-A-disaccharide synthase [Elusimicrobiota bacterium]